MHRTDADGNVGGLFSDGNPSTGVLGTKVDDDWLNAVQEEICNLIEAAGITLVKGTNTQLRAALEVPRPARLASDVSTTDNVNWTNLLSFAVEANQTYEFEFRCMAAAAAGTTGIHWRLTYPVPSAVSLEARYWTDTGEAVFAAGGGFTAGAGIPVPASPFSVTPVGSQQGLCVFRGIFVASASGGTVQLQHKSEVSGSQVTVMRGSFVRWRKTS